MADEPEVVEVELTDAQEEIAEWLIGCPVIEEWHNTETVMPGFERAHLPQPELEDGTFRFPVDEDLIYFLAHPQEGDLARYADMAEEAAEVSKREAVGIRRAASNLADKIRSYQ